MNNSTRTKTHIMSNHTTITTKTALVTGLITEKEKNNNDYHIRTWYGRLIKKPERLSYK